MTKNELIERLMERTGMTKFEAKQAIETTLDIMRETLMENGECVVLHGFGTFNVKEKCARRFFNVHTKRYYATPSSKKVTFAPSKNLKFE